MDSESRKLIEYLRRISKYGKSEITIDIYIRHIAPGIGNERINHNLAVAELMSRLAPEAQSDAWYITGLLHELPSYKLGGEDTRPQIMAALLKKARTPTDITTCIINYGRATDPRRWNSMMTALCFADSHTGDDGVILTTKECCELYSGMRTCNECSYARFNLSCTGQEQAAEAIIEKLMRDLDISEEKRRSMQRGKEETYGKPEARGEEALGEIVYS